MMGNNMRFLLRQAPSVRTASVLLRRSLSTSAPRLGTAHHSEQQPRPSPNPYKFNHNSGQHDQHGQRSSSTRLPFGLTSLQAGIILAGAAYVTSTHFEPDRAVEISWTDFDSTLIGSGLVQNITVVGGTRVHAHLDPHADLLSQGVSLHGPAAHTKHFVFTVPSPAWFEKHLDAALSREGMEQEHWPCVRFASSHAWEWAWALTPTLGFCAFLFFLESARQGIKPSGLSWRSPSLWNQTKTKLGIRTQSHRPLQRTQVTLDAVRGLGAAKAEVEELGSFLSSSHTHRAHGLGARVPKGALLTGPPGAGKTFLARAVAGSAGVPLFACSGSEFSDTYSGVGAARVRELFAEARKNAPSLVFVDEIDALGRERGNNQGSSGTDEKEATLNELLAQLDGFASRGQVLVLAATNRPDVLDPALKRAGRFDRHIDLPPPDEQGRQEIFSVHLAPLTLDAHMDPGRVASIMAAATPGWSGAAIAAVCNDAALLAARHGVDVVTKIHLDQALARVQKGPLGPRPALSDEEKPLAALHTASRIAGQWYMPLTPLVSRAGLGMSTGSAPGWIISGAAGELASKEQLGDRLTALLAGRAGEELFLSSLTTASQDDMVQATQLANKMVCQYGMYLGPLALSRDETQPSITSKATQATVDMAMHALLSNAQARAHFVLKPHQSQIKDLAYLLQQQEAVGSEDIQKCLGPRPCRTTHTTPGQQHPLSAPALRQPTTL